MKEPLDFRTDRVATMIRYECDACDMVATCIMNSSAGEAWVTHMSTHAPEATYRCWIWEVIPLPFK